MYTHLIYDIMFKLGLGCVFKEQILILITGSASNFILDVQMMFSSFPSI